MLGDDIEEETLSTKALKGRLEQQYVFAMSS